MKSVSFGGVVASPLTRVFPTWVNDVPGLLRSSYLPVGNGRSYGDVGLGSGVTEVSSAALNRFVSFADGLLTVEAGVLLDSIQSLFVPRGWMLPVTPGTAFVSVAGAIANDVHGKDHHVAGTFGEHVVSFTLVRSTGEVLVCSRSSNAALFHATIGGLGLTGFIVSATIQLKQVAGPFFDTEVIPYGSLDEFFAIASSSEAWQATVSWFDCSTKKAGRGSFTRGNHSSSVGAVPSGSSLAVPFTPPFSLVNKLTLDGFNSAYFALQKRAAGKSLVHYRDFYYPLDGVRNWNRIYGPRGFYQYQSVVPMDNALEVTSEMLSVIRKSGQGSFLAVLKTFGDRPAAGMMSFARAGTTLALDFPNRGEKTRSLFASLDRIVLQAGGALNPSKDAMMSRELFEAGFPQFAEFMKHCDPSAVSDFSRRVGIR